MDHTDLDTLLDELLRALCEKDPARGASLWATFASGLIDHMKREEGESIPALLRAGERNAFVILQEHRHLRARLAEVTAAMSGQSLRPEMIIDLRDELRAHEQTESRLMDQHARKNAAS